MDWPQGLSTKNGATTRRSSF